MSDSWRDNKNIGGVKSDFSFSVFQDVHVMIFVGFGFLMTFLRSYAYSAVGFTLLLGAYVIQWSCLVRGFFRLKSNVITLGVEELVATRIQPLTPCTVNVTVPLCTLEWSKETSVLVVFLSAWARY